MTRSWSSVLVLLVAIVASAPLGGCTGCDAHPHASAQGPDGGVAIIIVEPTGPALSAAATCFLVARRFSNLTDVQIEALCLGAPTPTGPADCYRASRRLALTDDQRLILCRCSPSAEPVACFRRVDSQTGLTDQQIQTLCSPVLSLGLLANCRALGGY